MEVKNSTSPIEFFGEFFTNDNDIDKMLFICMIKLDFTFLGLIIININCFCFTFYNSLILSQMQARV